MKTARPLLARRAVLLWLFVVFFVAGPNDFFGSVSAGHLTSGRGCPRVVALTFDDGPYPPYTEQIVDILASREAVATFFVEGQAAVDHPEALKLLQGSGMAIGSHSFSHSESVAKMNAGDFRLDLQRTEAAIENVVGQKPQLYRAPFGKTSATMLRELHDASYTSVGWDVDSGDWREADAEKIAERVLSKVRPGSVVLLHDGSLAGGNADRGSTVAALPVILAGLSERGYEFVTIPGLLDPDTCITGPR